MRIRERYLTSATKLDQIYTVLWLPDRDPEMILQICHGMIEHIGRYEEFAQFLCDNGIAVLGHDQLGHGKSVSGSSQLGFFAARRGDRALIEDLSRVAAYAQKEYPEAGLFLLGHSMGSFIARAAVREKPHLWKGLILSGTGYFGRPTASAGLLIASLLRNLRGDFYRSSFLHHMVIGKLSEPFEKAEVKSWLTRDSQKAAEHDADPMCGFLFTAAAYTDFFRLMKRISGKKACGGIPAGYPILLISGANDPVGAFGKGPARVCRNYRAGGVRRVKLKLYEGCRHELLNEINRTEIYRDLLRWLMVNGGIRETQKKTE